MTRPRAVIFSGPTASGKTRMALRLARALGERGRTAEIISADSVQVYRHMDIGSDKPTPEERKDFVHHLVDMVEPDETFSAAEFGRRAAALIHEIWGRGGVPVVAGGTGFYVRSLREGLFEGPAASVEVRGRLAREAEESGLTRLHERLRAIDPESARRIHPNDSVRIIRALEVYELTGEPMSAHFSRQERPDPGFDDLFVVLQLPRELMYERINRRVDEMMERGLVEEVVRLRAMGFGPMLKSQQTLGYKQVHAMLDGEYDRERAIYLIKRDTRHYARRQLTWLRKEKGAVWRSALEPDRVVDLAAHYVFTGGRPEA